MKTWKVILRPIILAIFILMPHLSFGQIVAWQFSSSGTGKELTQNANLNDSRLMPSVLSRGSGITTGNLPRGFGAASWSLTKALAISTNEYFEISMQAKFGYNISLSTLDARIISILFGTDHGPTNYIWKYSIDGGTTFKDIGSDVAVTQTNTTDGTIQPPIVLSGLSDLQNVPFTKPIKLRLYAWGSTFSVLILGFGTYPVGDTSNSLAFGGSVGVENITISSSPSSLNIENANNSTATANITCNSTWTAASNQTWLTVNTGSTAGNGILSCTATVNPTVSTRQATITLSATGATDQTVIVTQAAGDATLSISATTANVAKTLNSTSSIAVTSNASWIAFSDQGWLNVTAGATGSAPLILTAATTNPAITTRVATVTVRVTGLPDKTITVTQAVGDATLSVATTTANVAKTINSTSTIDVTSNTTWTATSNQSWLNVNGGGTGNGTLTFNTTEINPNITTRSAIVTVKATGVVDKIVTVTQAVGDATLSLASTTANVAKTANSTANIIVTSNTSWTATSDQNWISITAGATGNATLAITSINDNLTINARYATITVKATGLIDKTITVIQAAGDASLSVSATTASVAKTANSTATVNVSSNTTWTTSSSETWLSVSSGATGNGTLTLTAILNPTINTRIATVTLKATGAADKTITVTQAAGDATLSVSDITANVAKTANNSVTLDVTSNTTWSASSDQNWISFTLGAIGNATLRITTLVANLTIVARSATITLKATGAIDKTITVTQAAGDATLSVSATTASVAKTANSFASVNVTSNTTWTATADQSWLTISPGLTGNGTLTFTANLTNLTINSRLATVTLKATGVADKTITVTQAAGDATLSVSAATVSLSETAQSTANVDVISNSTWTATCNQSWLTITAGGLGNAKLNFTTATVNPLFTTRTALVTVKASGTTDKIITVTQQANTAFVTVSNNSVVINPAANNSVSVVITSNTTWSASTNESWLTISNGANGILTFSATKTSVPRQGTVTISAAGVIDNIITVIQSSVSTDNNYQLNMTVTSIAIVDNSEIASGDIQLSAFIDNVIRGTTTLKFVESCNRYMAFLMVWGNGDDINKTITFKSYDPTSTTELTAINSSLIFMPENITGSAVNPYTINFSKKITGVDNFLENQVDVYPNPITEAFRIKGLVGINSILLTDLNGKNLIQKQISNNEAVSISTLPKGIYVLKISNKEGVEERKIVKK